MTIQFSIGEGRTRLRRVGAREGTRPAALAAAGGRAEGRRRCERRSRGLGAGNADGRVERDQPAGASRVRVRVPAPVVADRAGDRVGVGGIGRRARSVNVIRTSVPWPGAALQLEGVRERGDQRQPEPERGHVARVRLTCGWMPLPWSRTLDRQAGLVGASSRPRACRRRPRRRARRRSCRPPRRPSSCRPAPPRRSPARRPCPPAPGARPPRPPGARASSGARRAPGSCAGAVPVRRARPRSPPRAR